MQSFRQSIQFDSSGVQHQETGEIVPTPTEESV